MQRAPVICSYCLVVGFWKTSCSAKFPTCLHIFAKSILPKLQSSHPFHQFAHRKIVISTFSSCPNSTLPVLHCQLVKSTALPKIEIFTGCPNAWNVFLFCPSVCPWTKDCPIFSGCQILEKGFKTNLCLWMNGWTSVNENSWSLKMK
jgi:hypothetical protein